MTTLILDGGCGSVLRNARGGPLFAHRCSAVARFYFGSAGGWAGCARGFLFWVYRQNPARDYPIPAWLHYPRLAETRGERGSGSTNSLPLVHDREPRRRRPQLDPLGPVRADDASLERHGGLDAQAVAGQRAHHSRASRHLAVRERPPVNLHTEAVRTCRNGPHVVPAELLTCQRGYTARECAGDSCSSVASEQRPAVLNHAVLGSDLPFTL